MTTRPICCGLLTDSVMLPPGQSSYCWLLIFLISHIFQTEYYRFWDWSRKKTFYFNPFSSFHSEISLTVRQREKLIQGEMYSIFWQLVFHWHDHDPKVPMYVLYFKRASSSNRDGKTMATLQSCDQESFCIACGCPTLKSQEKFMLQKVYETKNARQNVRKK